MTRVTQIHYDAAQLKFVLEQIGLFNFVPASGNSMDRTKEKWIDILKFLSWVIAIPTSNNDALRLLNSCCAFITK